MFGRTLSLKAPSYKYFLFFKLSSQTHLSDDVIYSTPNYDNYLSAQNPSSVKSPIFFTTKSDYKQENLAGL